jgi:hypothetical protein
MNSTKHRMCFRASMIIAGAMLLASVTLVAARPLSAHVNTGSNITSYPHVFVIMMENTSYTSLIGNSNAPWINSMATTSRLATNYTGVTHPSQPNYIAATSGSTNGVSDDSTVTIDVPNIIDQLEAKGKKWKAGYLHHLGRERLSLWGYEWLLRCGTRRRRWARGHTNHFTRQPLSTDLQCGL